MRFKPSIRVAFAAVVIVLISSAVGFRASVSALNLYLRKESVPLRESLDTIPMKLGRWKRVGIDSRLGEAMVESLGTRFYLDRHYAIDGNPANGVMTLHIAYYTGMIDAIPHVPERCWGAAGLVMISQPLRETFKSIDQSGIWFLGQRICRRDRVIHRQQSLIQSLGARKQSSCQSARPKCRSQSFRTKPTRSFA